MAANTGKLAGRTIFISGASRGIGQAIALKCAKDGANIVIAAKTAEAHPKLPGTIYSAAKEMEAAGGKALPCVVDIRDEKQIQKAIDETVQKFGGIDILVNNASAISLTGTDQTSMKKFDLMHQINTRGTYLWWAFLFRYLNYDVIFSSKLALPFLRKSPNPHILNISPPLNMSARWFRDHVAYTMAKYGMSMCVLGMAEEFRDEGIAVNALWPRTAIWTAAMAMLGGGDAAKQQCRTDDIMADAAYVMLTKPSKDFTGNFSIDDEILADVGVRDLDKYACVPGAKLLPDFFLESEDPDTLREQFQKEGATPAFGRDKSAGDGSIERTFAGIKAFLNADTVKAMNSVYLFELSGPEAGTWHLDLKNGNGAAGQGAPSGGQADVTFSMSSDDFISLFHGRLNATMAFMSGKMKISGDMGKAMKLEKLVKETTAKL